MTRRDLLCLAGASVTAQAPRAATSAAVLEPEDFRHYIDQFNRMAPEEVANYVPDAAAWEWIRENIPFFTCPDRDIEVTYYFRWWTYRKHIKKTPAGFMITEFLKPVKHAGEYSSLSCAFGHHIAEGRWLRDRRFIEQDADFWLRSGENGGMRKNFHQFSGWAAAALYDRWLVDGDRQAIVSRLDALVADYSAWERERLTESGLFWQRDVADGMEESISGGRNVKNIRPSINSYMYGNACAISAVAGLADRADLSREFSRKAAWLKKLVEERLWNPKLQFFDTLRENGEFAGVRENIGYTPWYFNLPTDKSGYEAAWTQLMDAHGFYAPFGPTTAERRNPHFSISYEGDDCQWNGPSWPFATTITLRALANVLNQYHQNFIGRDDYTQTFRIYTKSQRRKLPDGTIAPWIDEDLNPFTGEWLARAKKERKKGFYERGQYYNHSTYADLVITGLAGLRPRADDIVEVNPLAKWDWFCLDRISYHGRFLTIIWDKDGNRFGRGKGLTLLADGKTIAHGSALGRVAGALK